MWYQWQAKRLGCDKVVYTFLGPIVVLSIVISFMPFYSSVASIKKALDSKIGLYDYRDRLVFESLISHMGYGTQLVLPFVVNADCDCKVIVEPPFGVEDAILNVGLEGLPGGV